MSPDSRKPQAPRQHRIIIPRIAEIDAQVNGKPTYGVRLREANNHGAYLFVGVSEVIPGCGGQSTQIEHGGFGLELTAQELRGLWVSGDNGDARGFEGSDKRGCVRLVR